MGAGTQLKGRDLLHRNTDSSICDGPVIICDGLKTPENLGSILRVADAAGSNKIWLLDSKLDLKNKKLSKLARSTEKHLQIKHLSLASLIENNPFRKMLALEITTHSNNIFETRVTDCDAIILGHESTGIRQELLNLCHSAVHLPMYGSNGSMNISHALAVFLYEWRRQIQCDR